MLMKRWASGESAKKQLWFEDPAIQNDVTDTPIAFTTIRRRPTYTRIIPVWKKKCSSKKKDSRKKSLIQELGERADRYNFLNSLAHAPVGITFGQIPNGDIVSVRKQF